MKDEVGVAGKKNTQIRFVRDSRICYTSLRLLFFNIMHLLISTYLSSAACGRHSGCFLVVTMVRDSQFWFNRIIFYSSTVQLASYSYSLASLALTSRSSTGASIDAGLSRARTSSLYSQVGPTKVSDFSRIYASCTARLKRWSNCLLSYLFRVQYCSIHGVERSLLAIEFRLQWGVWPIDPFVWACAYILSDNIGVSSFNNTEEQPWLSELRSVPIWMGPYIKKNMTFIHF